MTNFTPKTNRHLVYGMLGTLACLAAGCSSQQLYNTGQAYQRNQCLQLPDPLDRERCLGRISTSHDDYQKEVKAARHTPE